LVFAEGGNNMDLKKIYEGIFSHREKWENIIAGHEFNFNCNDILNVTWDGFMYSYKNIVLKNINDCEWKVTVSDQDEYELKILIISFEYNSEFRFIRSRFEIIDLHNLY
jgi:hypothetical protein